MNGEYLLKDGIFMTSRLVDAESANTYLASKFTRQNPEMQQLQSAGRPIKLATAAPGLLDKLEWVTDLSTSSRWAIRKLRLILRLLVSTLEI